MAYLLFLNKKHEKKRVSMGKSAKIIDHSMVAVGTLPAGGKEEDASHAQQGEDDNAFKDLTDLVNEDFVYVY